VLVINEEPVDDSENAAKDIELLLITATVLVVIETSNAMLEEPAANDDEVLRGARVELKAPKT
jgi:hypothetical protein